ncbi:hypothetical protein [Providencia burhodogranariea]|uniref:Uncharacterized protein n=1 Tax=Providencia burhodogranariea DSM 19968 TaxID=1141662 RepID=K8WYP7_9GAMM|nr:hypothetical protein [Providencia burhodogranariea]EKT62507.1 hypothetical protein OOA_06858 [Providencia burhodogranariea DSM 19968]
MNIQNITVQTLINGKQHSLELILKSGSEIGYQITLLMNNQPPSTVTDIDFYECFARLREQNADITFLCKGAKINVYPSRMARQMSGGMMAYECTIGQPALLENIVSIFDFDEHNIAKHPDEQVAFHQEWLNSF